LGFWKPNRFMTEAVATIKGKKLDARYTLLDKLGAGGQGEVWRAHDDIRGVDIALKVLNPGNREDEAWSALQHEYKIASLLDHPSILKVFEPERAGEAMVLPMELASGGDLRRLRGAGFLEIIPVLLEIAQALEHAHERGVVHRDLKPGNVLFDARGRARLADFGVAETAMIAVEPRGAGAAAAATRDTNRHGFSPFTASPAQLRGDPPTPADDVYGLGALAYELLSGYPPYYPHFDKKRAIEERVPTLVPTRQIPPLLGTLVMHMLAKDPKRRPRTMREVIDELDAALNDTLTYDFENVSPAIPTASTAIGAAAAAGLAAKTASAAKTAAAAKTASAAAVSSVSSPPKAPATSGATVSQTTAPRDSQPKASTWTPDGGDRRSSADRRGRRKEDWAPQPQVTPRAGVSANEEFSDADGAERSARRTGAEALARIDAALERAAAEAEGHPKPSNPNAITPAEAAAIVAAARAAASPSIKPAAPAPAAPASPPAASANASPTPVAPEVPTRSMWPLEGRAAATPMHPSAAAPPHGTGQPYGNGKAQPHSASQPHGSAGQRHGNGTAQPHGTAQPQSQSAPAQPAFAHSTLTVGTYPDPTSILTRDTVRPGGPMHVDWGEVTMDGLPKVARLQPIRPRRWPWVAFGLVAGAAAAIYFWLPRFDTQTLPPEVAAVVDPLKTAVTSVSAAAASSPMVTASAASSAPAEAPPPAQAAADEHRLRQMRQSFDNRLTTLEARGAGVWGGREFAMAKTRAAESVGAHDAGNARVAQERLAAAMKLLDTVESKAPQALSVQVAAGEHALGAGQQEVAGQAFDLARRISPNDRRASDGQRRAQNLPAILPLLADAQNAEVAHDYARAAQDYSQALSLDPGNATAKAGQARANAAFGDDNYAKAVGTGFAALGAGRLDEAHEAFVKARALKPNGAEATEGLRRVGAALTARGFASMRQRAVGLESQERWDEAERTYEDVLAADSSLAFAQEGKVRATSRADLSIRLQQVIDRPDRLSSSGVRDDARALLETALAQSPQGPMIRSQIARLEALLPAFDKPVRLSLVSDNSTQVAISSIGVFGAFSRRDIELRPGKYTVVGTRNGFRDVRREITVAPGQDSQTIRVTCSEPI
jgi:serine/threonine protein kinase/tetratricopeptide (TPR) repeat protein